MAFLIKQIYKKILSVLLVISRSVFIYLYLVSRLFFETVDWIHYNALFSLFSGFTISLYSFSLLCMRLTVCNTLLIGHRSFAIISNLSFFIYTLVFYLFDFSLFILTYLKLEA